MAVEFGRARENPGCWRTLADLADADGSASHSLVTTLTASRPNVRGGSRLMADAVHLIGLLHGRHPGLVDHAAARTTDHGARDWLNDAAQGFAGERAYVARLVSAVGPMPSTPGQAESETAVAAQRHALDMLGASDRNGCAMGAALAVLLDWPAIRGVLDAAADRFGVTIAPVALPSRHATADIVNALEITLPVQRALGFGAQQVLAQHRGLWSLIESRASARGDL